VDGDDGSSGLFIDKCQRAKKRQKQPEEEKEEAGGIMKKKSMEMDSLFFPLSVDDSRR